MNRRKVLTALGGITIGGGALLGTGAFSSVSAERTVNVQTSGDSSAVVQFSVSGGIAGPGNDTIEFSRSDINTKAVTEFTDALEITIPSGTNGTTYDVELKDGGGADIHHTGSAGADETTNGSSFQLVGGDNSPLKFDTTGDSDDSKSLDVVVNTLNTTSGDTSISVGTLNIVVTDTS